MASNRGTGEEPYVDSKQQYGDKPITKDEGGLDRSSRIEGHAGRESVAKGTLSSDTVTLDMSYRGHTSSIYRSLIGASGGNDKICTVHLHTMVSKVTYYPDLKSSKVKAYFWKPDSPRSNILCTVEMMETKKLHDGNVIILQGVRDFPLSDLQEGMRYSYCHFTNGREPVFECIPCKKNYEPEDVYRWLQSQHQEPAIFHRYDNAIRVERPLQGKLDELRRKDAEKAIKHYFPCWVGFRAHGGEQMQATKALQDVFDIVESVTVRRLFRPSHKKKKLKAVAIKGVKPSDVISDILLAKLDALAPKGTTPQEYENATINSMIHAIAIAILLEKYNIQYKRKELYHYLARTMFITVTSNQQWNDIKRAINREFDTQAIRFTARSAIVHICNTIIEDNNGDWKYCLPVLQLFDDSPLCLTNSENITDLGWWGLSGVHVNAVKYKPRSQKQQDEDSFHTVVVKNLSKYFDEMITRSLTFLIPSNSEEMVALVNDHGVPEYIVTARLLYEIARGQIEKFEKTGLKVISFLEHRISTIALKTVAHQKIDREFLRLMRTEFKIAMKLLQTMHDKKFHLKTVQLQTLKEYFLSHIYLAKQARLEEQTSTKGEPSIDLKRDIVQGSIRISELLCATLDSTMSTKKIDLNRELQAWSDILKVRYSQDSDDLWSIWRQQVMVFFKQRLTTITSSDGKLKSSVPAKSLIKVYLASESMEIDPLVNDTIESAVSDNLSGCESEIEKEIFSMNQGTSGKRYAKLLSKLICRDWPIETSNLPIEEQLKMLLTMTLWPKYFNLKDQHRHHLPEEGRKRLDEAVKVLKEACHLLLYGNLSINLLQTILGNSDNFEILSRRAHIASIKHHTDQSGRTSFLQSVIAVRKCEKEYLETYKTSLSYMLDISKQLSPKVDTTVLTKAYALLENEQSPLSMLYNVRIFPMDLKEVDNYQPTINPELLPKEVHQIITEMPQDTISRRVFARHWDKWKEKQDTRYRDKVRFEAVAKLWPQVKDTLASLVTQIHAHSMTLHDIKYYFTNLQNESIRDALGALFSERTNFESNAKSFLERVEDYLHCQEAEKPAQLVLQCKGLLHLQGDFQLVNKLVALIYAEDVPITNVTQDLVECSNTLRTFDEKRCACLSTLLDCKEVIAWCKEVMKDASQVRAYTSLLLREVEESDVDMDKVAMFQAAITGYCPIVIELAVESNWNQFSDACKAVWTSLDSDEELSNKLINSQRQLEWLKNLVDVHNPSEVKCFHQMEIINHGGVYHITNPNDDGASLDKYVTLEVTSDEMDAESIPKQWSLSQLQDLRSKLMLSAGKSESEKSNLKTFLGILEHVSRLANNFVTLRSNGDLYFSDWKVDICCKSNLSTKYSVRIQVGKEGPITSQADPLEVLKELGEFMEGCIREWKIIVDKARDKYKVLNNFNIKQINILRKQLACLLPQITPSSAGTLAVESAELLGNVMDGESSLDQIPNVISSCLQNVDTNVRLSLENDETAVDLSVFTAFVQQVKEYDGVTDIIARAAFQKCSGDIDDGVIWCIDHPSEDDDEVREMYEAFKETEYADISDVQSQSALADAIRKSKKKAHTQARNSTVCRKMGNHEINHESVMVRQLVEHWIRYQVDQTMMTEQNVRHLSLDFLGLLLETLVKEEHDHQSVSGEPLMIPCDKVEKGKICIFRVQQENVLKACMTLYFSDKKVQRPESGDVLICSEDTTKEEVDLFWRRAVKGSYGIGRLFCLLRPELLPNHIMQYSTDCFNSHCQGRFDYYVAIICSEGSDKWIATSFDDESMDVRTLDCLSDEQLTEYLCEFLQPSGKRHKSSSVNDPDRFGIKAITSSFPGNGKSLLVAALQDQLVKKGKAENAMVKIPVHTTSMKCRDIASRLIDSQNSGEKRSELARIYHIDISSSVKSGIDEFIFNLAILKQLSDDKGRIWRRRTMDVYFIEATIMRFKNRSGTDQSKSLLEILPKTFCLSPSQTLNYIKRNPSERNNPEIHALDDEVFSSKPFQHVYFYLKDFKEMTTYATSAGLPKVDVKFSEKIKNVFKKKGKLPTHKDTAKCLKKISINNRQTCLELLLEHIRVQNPTWAVLHQFVRFFDFQLSQWEKSPFCDDSLSDDLPDLRIFVLKFILIISQDFATPSLNISDRSFVDDARREEELVDMYKRRRTWEKSPHPYVFFNEDGSSLTFHGFLVREDGSLSSTADRELNILGISMSFPLRNALLTNGVELSVDFDTLKRHEQVQRMQRVLNLQCVEDPDPSYELTTDCVTKMLAILMRFRCSIPVVIMGETGCGKTRLIRYLCEMMKGPDCPRNFFLMKVHGGTTFNDIEKKVELAEEKALENGDGVYTILFFDEANTTEAVSLIKEVMLDRSVNGRPLKTKSLKFVAACNPYRMLPEKAIKNLEAAGLGFRVRNAVDSREKLGNIPLRHLVYRVHQLPPSLLACVWDFGQLSLKLEESYIRSMVKHGLKNPSVKLTEADNALIIKVLVASHDYMRRQEEECRFVTLRDIERVINVFTWLYVNYDLYGNAMDEQFQCKKRTSVEGSGAGLLHRFEGYISSHITNDTLKVKRCIILTAGICYHSSLKNRLGYRKYIARCFTSPYTLNGEGEKAIEEEISRCQDVFLDGIKLNPNIARNEALKENVFMIIVCLELRIPIFLVGKPGSSKSLAKTIVDNDMKGLASSSKLLKNLKSVQMWSCQCSQHSTAETIIETFNLCANFQRKQQLDKKLGVVVLDEVGLAEDTPSLPLKTLHPLLENGCIEDTDTPAAWKKVGFIGMSNWALDPAKMNRGIFVVRDVPSISEIENTAREIASADDMKQLIKPLSVAYLDLFRQCSEEREYYGLRDFYGLIKLLSAVCKTQGRKPTWQELKHCVFRNFDGHQTLNAIDYFHVHCKVLCTAPKEDGKQEQEEIYHCSSLNLVRANLNSVGSSGETRYLMLMTNHSAAHDVIWHLKDYVGKPLLNAEKTLVIFGSQYQRDQGYTQVCRNIKRIKLCMETGQTVVLINADNLYESLYDTMNQYYFEYGDLRYVNLGLGTNRFNSRVSKDFRLIIIAERDIVMKNYPIPLINRLEKHFLTFDDLLTTSEHNMVDEMKEWVKSFVAFDQTKLGLGSRMDYKCNPENAFIGLGDDTIAMIVHQLSIQKDRPSEQDIRNATRAVLLQYCTPDAVARLSLTPLGDIAQTIREEYFDKQRHSSLTCFLDEVISSHPEKGILAQVTTHGKLLNVNRDLANLPNSYHGIIDVLNLQQFTSEQEIRDVLQDFYSNGDGEKRTLVFQLAADLNNFKLIPFIRYLIQDEWRTSPTCNRHVVLVLHFSRIGENVPLNIPISPWLSIHIDELRQPTIDAPQVERVAFKALSDILSYNEGDAVNATAILKMCIQSAVGKIETRYKIESPASHNLSKKDLSKEELVGVLQDLLGDDSHMESTSFPKVVTKRLCLLLKEKEKSLVNNGANWARNEVFSAGSLIAGGTLRRTLILKLCSEITPLFAELISYMNLHNGIQQLKKFKGEHSCLYLLWLSLFEDDSMTRINLDSSIKHSLSVMGPGPSVHKNNIEWKFPFSWVIFEAINEVIDSAESLQYGDQCERLGLRYWKILESGSIGRTIVKPLEKLDCDWNEVLTTYLHDFIHMVYKSEHKVGYKLASQFILKTAKKTLPSFRGQEEERHHINFVDIHLAYRNVKGRLGNLNRLINNMPETCDKLDSSEQDEDMDLDLVILHNCLQNLIPTKDQLKDVSFREKWLNDLPNIGAVAQHICVGNGHLAYNSECQTLINACRIKWNAIAMIRLYMEHLSPPDEECKESVVKYAYAFFQSLLNEKEVSKLSHFKKVEKLLKTCNSSIVKRYFGGQACMAGTHQLAATFVLISGKPYCRKCFKADPSVSPENPTDNETFHNSVQDYKLYLQKCSVFLLELVSSFYLKTDGIESVDDEMIERLFAYIAIEGILFKPKTSSSDVCIDTSPVVRSYLLQLLLSCGKEKIEQCLQAHLNECLMVDLGVADDTLGAHESLMELVVLYAQCIEDTLVNTDEIFERMQDAWERIEACTEQQYLVASSDSRTVRIQDIHDVAIVRSGLRRLAEVIHIDFERGNITKDHSHVVALFTAKSIISRSKSTHMSSFLLKQICRRYSLDYLVKIKEHEVMNWIIPEMLMDKEEATNFDQFAIHGKCYSEIKKTLTSIRDGEETTSDLVDMLQRFTVTHGKGHLQVCFLLALFHKNTIGFEDMERKAMVIKELKDDVIKFDILGNSTNYFFKFLDGVLNIQQPQGRFFLLPTQRKAVDRWMTSLLVHFCAVMSVAGNRRPLEPLFQLIHFPDRFKNSYLPSMPDDDFQILKCAFREDEGRWYFCPNGHPYFIGECGKPWIQSTCQCGAKIGGEMHHLRKDNTQSQNEEQPTKGHILGKPEQREDEVPISCRKVGPVSFAVLRFITHAAMFLGCMSTQDIANLIHLRHKSHISEGEVVDFLIQHMKRDVQLLAKAIGHSEEEANLTLHVVLCSMMTPPSDQPGSNYSITLQSKEDRSVWEHVFANCYIGRAIENLENKLEDISLLMAEDAELENELVTVALFEKDRPPKTILQPLFMTPFLWRYQSRPSLKHLKGILQGRQEQNDEVTYPVLTEFMRSEHKLSVLRYLPDIIDLQLLLKRSLHLRIARNDTSMDVNANTQICTFLDQYGDQHLRRLVGSLSRAWEKLKQPMMEEGLTGLQIQDSDLYSDCDLLEMPLSAILPTIDGNGVSLSLGVVEALVTIQNQFLVLSTVSQVVKLTDVAKAHLIAFDPEEDLEPLVVTHCDYSLEMGRGTCLDYNFEGLERQIITKFVQGKSRVQREVILFTYADSICDKIVFERLRRLIPQTEILPQVENEIITEFRERLSLPDLHTALRSLDLAIAILNSSGGNPGQLIQEYLTEALRLRENDGLMSEKARKNCTLSNLLSLWQICEIEKTKQLIDGGLDPFDDIQPGFKHEIPHALKTVLERHTLKQFRIDTMENMLKLLYEFITLELKVGVHTEVIQYEPLRFRIDSLCSEDIHGIECISDEVLLTHVVDFWKSVNKYLSKQKKQKSTY